MHVVPSLDPRTGGPARSSLALARAESALGAEVVFHALLAPGQTSTLDPAGEPFAVRISRPAPGTFEFPTPAFARAVRESARGADAMHFHATWNPAITVAAREARRARVPYVLSPRGMLRDDATRRKSLAKRAYHALVERRTLGSARAIHFLTEEEARHSRALTPAGVRSFVLPNGVPADLGRNVARGAFRASHGLGPRRLLVYLGRLHETKRLHLQVEALATLVREGHDAALALVGPDAGDAARLRDLAASLGVEDRLVTPGEMPREACLEALADADCFLLTSEIEGHSNALNEALALGTPAVVVDSAAIPGLAEAGAGRVVPGEAAAVAREADLLLREPSTAAKMREAARRYVAERLAWGAIARRMLEEYRSP